MDSENGMYSGAALAASLRGFSPKEVSSELEAIPEFKYEGIELGDENGDYSLCWYPEGRLRYSACFVRKESEFYSKLGDTSFSSSYRDIGPREFLDALAGYSFEPASGKLSSWHLTQQGLNDRLLDVFCSLVPDTKRADYLLSKGADPLCTDSGIYGNSILHNAAADADAGDGLSYILRKLPADTVCRLAVIKNRKGMTPWDVAVQRYRHLFSSEGPDELRLSEGFQKLASLVAPEKSMREICLEIEGARGVRGLRVYSAARAAEFAGCMRKQHGMEISEPDARTFLSHLAEEGSLAASAGKQFYCFKSGDPASFPQPLSAADLSGRAENTLARLRRQGEKSFSEPHCLDFRTGTDCPEKSNLFR